MSYTYEISVSTEQLHHDTVNCHVQLEGRIYIGNWWLWCGLCNSSLSVTWCGWNVHSGWNLCNCKQFTSVINSNSQWQLLARFFPRILKSNSTTFQGFSRTKFMIFKEKCTYPKQFYYKHVRLCTMSCSDIIYYETKFHHFQGLFGTHWRTLMDLICFQRLPGPWKSEIIEDWQEPCTKAVLNT